MDLKIFVTHTSNKNDETIDNPLYIDVVAGAVNQRKTMPEGFVGDNTGDNISEKNKYYCELSTQYWAWKNVEADYYGFCHYRRYMTLSKKDYSNYGESSRRGQINASVLSPTTVEMFDLDNWERMKKFVEQYDIVLPVEQDLSKLPTCQGIKKDVYGHFAGHDRMFMHAPDLDLLMDLIDRLYPEYTDSAHKFMRQSSFWGFNCFVMKKELFNELCDFEFTILEEMEKHIDNTYYNRQQSRIYGFMAEILSCLFFYHLKRTRKDIRFGETQLIYFDHTEKIVPIKCSHKKENVNLLFDLCTIENTPYYFDLTVNSFLSSINHERDYNVIIAHNDMSNIYRQAFEEKFAKYQNINLQYLNWNNVAYELKDQHLEIDDYRVILPWILKEYDKLLVLPWNVIINNSVDRIYDVNIENYAIAAVNDLLFSGHVRSVDGKYENYLRKYMEIDEHGIMFSSEVYMLNLENIREKYKKSDFLIKRGGKNKYKLGELLNCVYGKDRMMLSMDMVKYYTEDERELKVINQSPFRMVDDYMAINEPDITIYSKQMLGCTTATKMSFKLRQMMHDSQYHFYFENSRVYGNNDGDVHKSKVMKKIDGGFKCVQDHGFWYTVGYTLRKPFLK